MTPVDLVLVEGYKHHAHDKIEVHRPSLGQPLVAPTDSSVIAIACDSRPANADALTAALLDLNDTAAITQFILSACGLDSHLTAPVGKAV
jgi:molybdopterin-guanine dinucleotide biosynthesis protein B